MNILAFDTTLDVCTAALADSQGRVVHRHEPMPRGQAERLPGMLREIMAQAGLEFSDLALIAVTTGPGTFSGTRIGLAAARALNIVAPVPVMGLTSLQVLAAAVLPETAAGQPIWSVIDARRGEFYAQGFVYEQADLREIGAPARCGQEQIAELITVDDGCLLVGSGAGLALPRLPGAALAAAASSPDARVIAVLARRIFARAAPLPADLPTPLYLRPPDAKLPQTPATV